MAFKVLSGNGSSAITKWATVPVGATFEGRLIGIKNGKVFKGKQSRLFVLQQKDGTQLTFPLVTVLESTFAENSIDAGAYIRITHLGMVKPEGGGSEYRNFKTEIDDASSSPATAAVPPAQAPAPQAPVAPAQDEYTVLSAKLIAHAGEGPGNAMLGALGTMYPDPAVRLEQLKTALKAQGVAL